MRVRQKIVNVAVLWSLLVSHCLVASTLQAPHQSEGKVTITVEKVERVSPSEANFLLKIANRLDVPVFVEGRDSKTPVPYLVYLEQWQDGEGWHSIAPCPDTPPPGLIKLRPGEALVLDPVLTNPINALCNERNVHFEGMFRFRLEYFMSVKDGLAHERNFFASEHPLPIPHVVVSEAFQIPPIRK